MLRKIIKDYNNFKKDCLKLKTSIPYDEKLIQNKNNIKFNTLLFVFREYPIKLTTNFNILKGRSATYSPLDNIIYISASISENDQIVSLFHEIAHFELHKYPFYNLFEEAEAETISYLVCKSINIINKNSKYYVYNFMPTRAFFDLYYEDIINTSLKLVSILKEELK